MSPQRNSQSMQMHKPGRVLTILLLFVTFAARDVAQAQVTSTATIYPIGFEDDHLQGQQIGTGLGGTTYQLSGTVANLSVPYTMTLVEDATHVSEVAVLVTGGTSVFINVNCGLANGGSGVATCTEVFAIGNVASTATESGTPSPVILPVGIASLDPNFTGTAQPATNSAGGGSGSVLGATIPVSNIPSATFKSGSATATAKGVSGALPRADADAARMALVAWLIAGVMAATTAGFTLTF